MVRARKYSENGVEEEKRGGGGSVSLPLPSLDIAHASTIAISISW